MRHPALLLLVATLFAATGCSSAEPNAEELVAATADELATKGPTYAQGAALRTTANLNLRSSGSTSAKILRVMPKGSQVKVRETSGASAWVAVSFSGYSGWAHTSYLVAVGGGGADDEDDKDSGKDDPAPAAGDYDLARAQKLASTALRVDGQSSGGYCARETSNSVERSGIIPKGVTWYRNHATDIAEYMDAHPDYDAKVGFRRIEVSPNDIPKGSIVGWRRGQCGYSSSYGHIEIAVNDTSTRACSDFCGSIKKTCGSPYVFVPTSL